MSTFHPNLVRAGGSVNDGFGAKLVEVGSGNEWPLTLRKWAIL
jgi:hypothetical protein